MDKSFSGRFEAHELPGHVRLFVCPSRKFKTVQVKVFLRTDLRAETATDIALLPYVLRHGTRSVPSKREISQTLESLFGAGLGVDVLKLGEQHVITFGLQVLADRFLPEGGVFQRGLRLLADLIRDPALEQGALRPAEVAQEKEKLRRFIEGLINDKGSYAAQRCLSHLCATEPYGVFEYGRLEDLERVDGASLEAQRRALLAEAPIDVYLTGAVETQVAVEALGAALALDRSEPSPLRGTTPHPPAADVREVRESVPGLSQAKLCMGFRTPTRLPDPGYWDLLMMHGILGGFPHSKLFRNVREGAGLCYDASSSIERFKGLVFIFAGIDAGKFEQTRDLCLEQLAAIARGEISDDELDNTRAGFKQGFRALLDSPTRLLNLDYLLRLGGRVSAPQELIAAIDAVTPEGIRQAAEAVRLDTIYFLEPEA